MKCFQCRKDLYEYNYLSLRKYSEFNDEEILEKPYDFCNETCAKVFQTKRKNLNDYTLYKISRCAGYYDCKRLDNLRNMCETEEEIEKTNGLFSIPHIPLVPNCDPAEVGIIKSNIKLLDFFDKFEESSTSLNKDMLKHTEQMGKINQEMLEHTKFMKNLTILILLLTFINLVLFSYQILKGVEF